MDSPINELTRDKSVRVVILVVLVLLAALILANIANIIATFGEVAGQQNTITVNGTGKAAAPPTIATIDFSVQANAATVSAAQDAATKQTNDALAAVKKLGIADADVQTSGYNVSPQYETKPCAPNVYCPQDTSKISGYQVSESIEVKVRDTGKAGDVLQALGTAGVQNISGPNFTIDDPSSVEADARAKAITDAKQKAQALAKQLGVHLGKVVTFSENGSGPVPYFAKAVAADSAAGSAPAPTLPTGQNETTSNVSVTYQIW